VAEVVAEAPDLKRLPAALVLPGVDARVEGFDELVVAGEWRVPVDGVVAAVNGRVERRSLDDDRLVDGRDQELNLYL
jgi:hypothetical protein